MSLGAIVGSPQFASIKYVHDSPCDNLIEMFYVWPTAVKLKAELDPQEAVLKGQSALAWVASLYRVEQL